MHAPSAASTSEARSHSQPGKRSRVRGTAASHRELIHVTHDWILDDDLRVESKRAKLLSGTIELAGEDLPYGVIKASMLPPSLRERFASAVG